MNHKLLKKLARSAKWQLLYNKAKELGYSIRLFNNIIDFGNHQIWYLYYLELYSSLYMDLSMGEEYIDEDVIKDDLRCEAYLLYRNEKKKNENLKSKSLDKNKEQIKNSGGLPRVIFKRRVNK